jgi:hypothetical protein
MNADFLGKSRYRLGELAQAMDKHISTIVRWTQRGVKGRVLRSYLLGGQRYIDREDVLAFIQAINGDEVGNEHVPSTRRKAEMQRVDEDLNRAGI